jgi:arylsulfatase
VRSAALALAAAALLACGREEAPGVPPAPPPTASPPASIRDAEPRFEQSVEAPAGSPNIVLVVADDLGYSDLGSFGGEIETPSLDALAERGLRYTHFTATAVCSATRAALLTGLDAHAAGVGWLAEWDFGFPGYRGEIAPDVATLPEILRAHGWSTLMVGKWHLTNQLHRSAIGPFDSWPTRRGFDRYFGFLDGETSQWRPHALVSGTELLPPDHPPDFYLPDVLTDRALAMLRDLRAHDARRPFFLYYASGAPHAPHHTKPRDREKYRGRYDGGWDAVREARLARQKELGIAPPDAELTAHGESVAPWTALSADQRRLYARLMENYAAYVDNLDQNVGRLVAFLASAGELERTVFVFLSDNGASREVGPEGSANNLDFFHGHPMPAAESLRLHDEIGGPATHPHYPHGWMEASNTPFAGSKRTTLAGGVRVPLIVVWPGGIAQPGEVRRQWHHVSDLAPTLLEIAGVPPPARVDGRAVRPMQGVSLRYGFDAPEAASRRREQYYEMEGDRGYYADGWRAVAHREAGEPWDAARWQLFHVADDFSEARDLSAGHPEKVRELEARWWQAADRHHVLPLIDVPLLERPRYSSFWRDAAPARFEYRPGSATIQRFQGPLLPNRTFTIRAEVERDAAGDDGVLVALGDRHSGFSLFVHENRLVYEHDVGYAAWRLVSDAELPLGPSTLRFRFEQEPLAWAAAKAIAAEGLDFDRLRVLAGTGSLWIGERKVAEGRLERPVFAVWEGMDVGCDRNTPVSPLYESPAPFRGRLARVVFELE